MQSGLWLVAPIEQGAQVRFYRAIADDLGPTLCVSKLWNYPRPAPKHLMPRSKEERGGSLRARSGAPDYTYKPDSEAEPRSRYAATAHPEMTAPNPSRCLHLALAQLLSSRDRLAGLAPVFMSPMPACASARASNRHNHRHT